MGKVDFELMVYIFWITASTIALLRFMFSLNDEGQVLLNWKRDHLDDPDNWNASDAAPRQLIDTHNTQKSESAFDFSSLVNLTGPIHTITSANSSCVISLYVGHTSLSGDISQDIMNCSNLVFLDLSENYVSEEATLDLRNLQILG